MIEFILYVKDQQKSRDFYSALLNKKPVLDVPGMTEFLLADNVKIGLMPEDGIAKILVPHTKHPKEGNGIPRCELYLYLENIAEIFQNGLDAGAKEISKISVRDWGDEVGYLADADGHIIALARKNTGK